MSSGQQFFQILAEATQEAKLGVDFRKLIGTKFLFGSEHGSHQEILAGTVKAVGLSDEGGLDLYVSTPRFFGRPLISIKRINGKWFAYVDDPVLKLRFYEGNFQNWT